MAEVASIYLPVGRGDVRHDRRDRRDHDGTQRHDLRSFATRDHVCRRRSGAALARIHQQTTATPIRGLTLTLICCAILLISGQLSLALNVAVFALVVLYFIHSLVFLFLPRLNPGLASEIQINLPPRAAGGGIVSLLFDGLDDPDSVASGRVVLSTQTLGQRINGQSLTSIELILVWGSVGSVSLPARTNATPGVEG